MSDGPFGHKAVFSGRGSGYSVQFPRLRVFGMGLSSRSRSILPAAGLPAGPFFARTAGARVRAFRAGAHIARLIARARGRRKAHVSRPFLGGFFRTGAKQETKRLRGRRLLLSHPSMDFPESIPFKELFLIFMNKLSLPVAGSIRPFGGQPSASLPVRRPGPRSRQSPVRFRRSFPVRTAPMPGTPHPASARTKPATTARTVFQTCHGSE